MNTEKLFSYGKLQYEAVQLTNFGQKLAGTMDTLSKFKLSELKITDADIIATSGEVVHPEEHQAKQKAVRKVSEWGSPHRDYLHEVDTVLDLSNLLTCQNRYLHLIEAEDKIPFGFTCCYPPIGKLPNKS